MSKRLDELKKEAEKARGKKISVANNSKNIADNHLKSLDVAPKTSLQDELMNSTAKTTLTERLKSIPTVSSYSGNGFTSGMPDMDTAPHQYSTGTGVVDKIGNFAKRVDNGLWGIHEGLGASLGLAEDAFKQSNKANSFNSVLKSQLENQKNAQSQIDYLKNYAHKGDAAGLQADPEYLQALKKLESNSRVINAVRNKPMDTSTQAFQDYALANAYKEKAVEGLSPTGRFIGNTAMSIGDNLAALPTAVINPNMPLAILGAKGAANKIYDVGNNGGTASEALTRGIVSGGIEAATEKIGLDNLMKLGVGGVAKQSGAELFNQLLRNTSKQSAIEGAEEGLSYIGNYGADKAFGDPNAKFDVKELGLSALGGVLSGGVMGGGASLVGNGATNSRVAEQNALQAKWESQQAKIKSQMEKQQAEQATYRQNVKSYADQQLNSNVPLLGRGADFTVDIDGTIAPVSNNTNETVSNEGNPNIQTTKEIFDTKSFNKGNFLDFEEGSTPNLSVREKSLIDSLITNADSKGVEPQKMAEIMIANTNKAVENEVTELATVMQNYKPQGVQQILMPDMDNNRNSVLGNKFARISNNEKWYSDLYRRTKRKPTASQIKGYAKELIEADIQKGGGEYVSNELAQNYSTAQALNDAVGKVFTGQSKVVGIEDTGDGYAVQYGRNRQEVVPDYKVRNGRQALVNRNDGFTPGNSKNSAEQELFNNEYINNMSVNNKYGKNTVGSAQANPNSLQSLADQYGQIPEGENPKARVAVLPTQIDDSGKKVSEAARTFIEAGAITDETASAIENSVLNGDYSHEVITDKEANVKAIKTLKKTGFAESLDRWNDVYENGGATKFDLALAQRLMAEASQAGNSQVANQIGVQMATELTRSGQLLQANRMLKRLSPEGMVTFAETQINQLKGELADKGIDQKIIDKVNLTDEDITFINDTMQAVEGMEDGREKTVALAQVKARIENKIPSSAGNKLKTLARMSMLFNPKTQVRNVLGNAIISPISNVGDVIGTAIDKGISQKTGQRTTSLPQPSALKGMKQGIGEAVEDYRLGINTRDIEGNRFEIGQGRAFNNDTKIGKVLNGIDRTTNFMLDAGDRGFYETWFNNSLEQQMKANNVDTPTEEMNKIAKNEALKRTWQDTNNYTEKVSMFRNALNGINVKGYGLGDMTLPFIKTPANLTKALVDYSPIGVVKTLKIDADNLKTAIKTGKDVAQKQRTFVDNLSKGITGTLLMVLYSILANKGILRGEGNKDKDLASFEKNILGIQPYSAVIGDKSYSYEWAQPVGGSMAMVADYKKAFDEADTDKGKLSTTATAIWEGISASGKVLFNQSFATGIANLFGEDDIINGLMEVALNEPSKFTSQLMGQVAQLGDGTARSTYVYGDAMATAANKVKAKIPGERNELSPVVDVMGNEVKSNNSVFDVFFNPANYYSDVSDGATDELYNIYKATGDKTVIPPTAPYYVMYKNNKTVLTPEQKADYQKTTGGIISKSVNSLIKDNGYMSLSDADKVDLLNDIYGYANATAKDKFVKGYQLQPVEEKVKTAEQSGIQPFEYLLFKQAFSNIDPTEEMNGSEENKAKRDLLYENDTLSADQKNLIDGMLINDGMYLPEEKDVNYADGDTFTLTQMSASAQKKWDRAQGLGYTMQEYEQYYPVVMSGKKKAEVLGDLQMQGLSYNEASTLYKKMKAK